VLRQRKTDRARELKSSVVAAGPVLNDKGLARPPRGETTTELQVMSQTAPLKRSENYRSRLSHLLGRRGFFALCVLALVGGSILRSAIVTRLDGFTIDEAYHITAGVSYIRNGDFQINPEHPPLVKLWVGSFVSATGFNLSPIRRFTDKPDERDFTEHELFLQNDFESVQRHARSSMFALNGLLLIGAYCS